MTSEERIKRAQMVTEIIFFKTKWGTPRKKEEYILKHLSLDDLFDVRDKWRHVAIVKQGHYL